MNASRRTVLRTAVAAAAWPWLGTSQACEFQSSHLRVTHPWTRATPPGADRAVLCMKFDEVQETDRLVGVLTPIASGVALAGAPADAPLALEIPAGGLLELHEEGPHLLLTGLHGPVQVGRQYPLQLTFEKGGVLFATLNVDFPPMRFR